ncbi:dockerin type I domain-containing protein [Halorussus marinus]|uniref:dockerin type I domain-containing protein n=1 Tax=Halorussus marinus TaxID=2505976 RepID=UPI0010928B08|nr:dockerin type I domain-containing protein [Halorussus marinus]
MTREVGATFGRALALAVAALVAVAAIGPAAAIPQPAGAIGLAQTPETTTVAPGETVTLETTINATGYNAPGLAVSLPDGWSVQSQSTDGPFTYKSATDEWVGLSGGEYTVTYTVAVPDDAAAGEYTVSADGSAIDPETDAFVEATDGSTVTVQDDSTTDPEPEPDPDPTTVSVSQSASGQVAPGGTVTMTAQVDATGLDAPALAVDLPDGWSVQSQTADGPASYKPATGEWVWLAGDVDAVYTVEYVVAVPSNVPAGEYTLTAEASALDAEDTQVTDAAETTVTVAEDDGQQPAGPSTAARLSPSSEFAGVDQMATFDVVVDAADGGIGVTDFTVSVADTEVAAITDASLAENGTEGLSDVEIAEDGSSVSVESVLMDTGDTGSVTLATVTVETAAEGATDLDLTVSALGTEGGTAYVVTETVGATLDVSELVVGDAANPAADPDGDGVYEDVNGDGAVDITDVQALWSARNDPTVANNPGAFDFNGDGSFSILDVQALYSQELGA